MTPPLRVARATRAHIRRDARGQALIEFALASVLFFTVVFAVLEFGVAIWRYNMVADLAQEGARWASVHGSSSSNPASTTDVSQFVAARAPFAVTVVTSPAPSTVDPDGSVTVTVRTSFAPGTVLIPNRNLTLQASSTMIVAR